MVLVVPRSLHRRIGQVPAPGVLGWPSILPQLPLYEVICPLHAEELNHVMRVHTLVTNFHCFDVSRKSSTSQENWTSSNTRCAGSTKHPATVTTVWVHLPTPRGGNHTLRVHTLVTNFHWYPVVERLPTQWVQGTHAWMEACATNSSGMKLEAKA